jgi:predicted unusual protein kinase regulating ubiquinone biosynthesis (AarF/ABC1/UbiB family)
VSEHEPEGVPGATPASAAPAAGAASLGEQEVGTELAARSRTKRPWRRLLKAYTVTTLVSASYLWLAFRRRFASLEGYEELLLATHRRNARRIEAAIVELQGLFIKVGQLISIMANFLPEAFRQELQSLQDQVPPRPFRDIEARFIEEFGGRTPTQVFAEFERRPMASASIGQVHVARLATGEKVAVKVQYPDIEAIVRTDLRALRHIFALLDWFLPEAGLPTVFREIREMVLTELDYEREAEAMTTIARNFRGRPDVQIPRVIAACSTGRVLTTEWMPGTKVADLAGLAAAGIDRKKAARVVVEAYCQQIFIDGIYHADPHPGNLLLRPATPGATGKAGGPALVLLDFGAVAHVSESMRRGLVGFLQGAMTRDSARIVDALKEMGFISRQANPAVFDRVVGYFHDKFRAQIRFDGFSLRDIKFEAPSKLEAILDLRELNVSLEELRDAFHVPKEWVLLERALLLLLGVCTTLDPEMNPASAVQPYLEKFVLGDKKEWSEAIVESSRDAALAALSVPGQMGRYLTLATRGDLEVRVGGLEGGVEAVYAVGQQLVWGLLGVAGVSLAVVFDGRGQERARLLAVVAAGACGLMLGGALLRGRRALRRRRR